MSQTRGVGCTTTWDFWHRLKGKKHPPNAFPLSCSLLVLCSQSSSNLNLCRLGYSVQVKAGISQVDLPGFGALEIEMQVMLFCEADSTVNLNA
jgi:hypothetical protein